MNKFAKLGLAGGVASLAALSGAANAALPTAATDAITAAGADLSTAILAVITSMVAVWGLRKLGHKMGWL